MSSRVVIILAILFTIAPLTQALDYTPIQITFQVGSDGVSMVDYHLEVDPTLARVSLPLVGSAFDDLLVVNQDGTPLDNTLKESTVTVDTLGSSGIVITYATQSLTSKAGAVWSWNATTPGATTIIVPAGATIVSLSQVPLELGIVSGRPYAVLPEGENSISYILGVVGTKEHALILIKDAEAAIAKAEADGVIVTEAKTLLKQSNTAYNTGDYSKAESLALDAKEKAELIQAMSAQAASSIASAEAAITAAESQGRTSGLDAAKQSLQDARSRYQQGDYSGASQASSQATQQAGSATSPLSPLLTAAGGAIVAVAVGAAALYIGRGRARKTKQTQTPKAEPTEKIDLESLFRRNPSLRAEDREVLRFLVERGGEAFANEVRERFEMPRTSVWRLIKRLEGIGVLEERKVGGQSLICLAKKYRTAQRSK
jgi:uncharacterized membrane protein